jgi:membrane fusion protein (multidrug efflux system)
VARPSIRLIVLSLAGLLAVAAFVLLRTSPDARSAREAETRRAGSGTAAGRATPARPTVTVDAVTVVPREVRTVVDVSGVLEPVRHVVIGAEVSGRVVSIEAREHTGVEADELLVRLDPALPRAAVERARAALLRAEAAERLAAAELARQQKLSRQGVASTAELERTESEARSASAQVAEARAALLDAETRLAKTEIRAPFAGVVSSLDLEPGAYLNPGEPVAELADISEVEIEVGLSDREILAVSDGDAVGVTVEALSGRRVEGRVVDPGRTADPQTRKYPVAVRVPNPDEGLLPGMLGTVRFELGDARPVLRVPRRSVFSEFDLDYVYVLEPEGAAAVARRRRVTTRAVPFRPDQLDVTAGLEAGEQVATSGIGDLREGLLVQVRPADREAAHTAETPRAGAGERDVPEPRS